MENVLRPFVARLRTTTLTQTQEHVYSNLVPIFPFYTKNQLDAVVLYTSADYIPPIHASGLLQRCIDFILDNPDAVEDVANDVSNNTVTTDVIDVFSDEDDFVLLGAADFDEADLGNTASTQLSQKPAAKNCGQYIPSYGDDLPVISPPRQRKTEKRDHVDIIISDSPELTLPQPVKSEGGDGSSVSSTEELPIFDDIVSKKTENFKVLEKSPVKMDDLRDVAYPKTKTGESSSTQHLDSTHTYHLSDSVTKQFVNQTSSNLWFVSSSSPKKTDPSCKNSNQDVVTDGASVSSSAGVRGPGNISKNPVLLSGGRAFLASRPPTEPESSSHTSESQDNRERTIPPTNWPFHFARPGGSQYPSYPQVSVPLHTASATYPGQYNYADVLPKLDFQGRTSSGSCSVETVEASSGTNRKQSVPGMGGSPLKTFRQVVNDGMKLFQGRNIFQNQNPGPSCSSAGSSFQTTSAVSKPVVHASGSTLHKDMVGATGQPAADINSIHTSDHRVTGPVGSNTQYLPSNSSEGPLKQQSQPPTVIPPPTVHQPPPPRPPPPKTQEQQLEEWKLEVLQLFPKVDLQHLDGRLRAHYGHYAVNNVCSELLEAPDYPRSQTDVVQEKLPPKEESVDYYRNYAQIELNIAEREQSLRLLQGEFRRVSVKDLREVWSSFKGHYAPAYKVLEAAMKEAYAKLQQNDTSSSSASKISHSVKEICIKVDYGGQEKVIVAKLLKSGRSMKSGMAASGNVGKEVEFVKKRMVEQKEKEDYEIAWKLNEAQYEEDGQTIECGCCFCEYPFESMVQCTEGHLFCSQCLLSYAKEAVFGSGKLNLTCMTTGCGATYPYSEMTRALPSEILCQYEARVREENLNLADLTNLVRCPHCNYAAIMDAEADKVFRCQNKECMKETCRLCKEDWAEHIGLPCEKVEKKDETRLRKEYEEKMTEAKVRTCHRCKSKYMKEEGCNKMTCTCRATMCYICRAPNIDYNHFCRHPRDPGKLCTLCKACSLWTNPDEDDKRAIEEIQKEAQEKRKEKGYIDDKVIGAPTQPAAKKQRKK